MSKTVILAEKPSQASAYAEAFDKRERKDGYFIVHGNGYQSAVITYGFGHLVELYEPNEYKDDWKKWQIDTLPIFPEKYQFKVSKDKVKQYKNCQKNI
ncbi:MAG: topoisomerase [Bacillaceae bacterium]|nr:topoisomerase [Bacillaceae bacterium]